MDTSQFSSNSPVTAVLYATQSLCKRKSDRVEDIRGSAGPAQEPTAKLRKVIGGARSPALPQPDGVQTATNESCSNSDNGSGDGATSTVQHRKKAVARQRQPKKVAIHAPMSHQPDQDNISRGIAAAADIAAKGTLITFLARATMANPVPPPTLTSSHDISCPIDWTQGELIGLEPKEIEVYELRAPWNPIQLSWKDVKDILIERYPGGPEKEETYRKRMWVANRAVYLVTGRWYKNTQIGLGTEKKSWKELVPKTRAGGLTIARCPGSLRNPISKYTGELFYFLVKESGNTYAQTCAIPLAVAMRASPVVKKHIQMSKKVHMIAPVPIDIIDRWASCSDPVQSQCLPTRIYPLSGQCIYNDWDAAWTTDSLFAVYIFSVMMHSFDVCSLIISHWRLMLHKEKEMIESYKSGARKFNDLPAQPMLRLLDFSPRRMNELWSKTVADDPARAFWIDVLKSKGQDGAQKIANEYDEYSYEFLLDFVEFVQIWYEVEHPVAPSQECESSDASVPEMTDDEDSDTSEGSDTSDNEEDYHSLR